VTRVALLVAAGSGMGAACARRLAADGWQVALLSSSGKAEALASELGGIGVTGSMTDPDALKQLVHGALERHGRIDAVVTSAGHPPKGELLAIPDEAWHQGLELLLLPVIRLARLVVPAMRRQGGGAFVNISTAWVAQPDLTFPVSCTVRAALGAFTKLFAERHAADNIRMNNVLPGYIDSLPATEERRLQIPMRRYGTVAEIAGTVAFLLSGDAGYITGQSLRVDGGIIRAL
jgi:NAD(P)-dependent dehydrogenase (short-subunit alcohol dehydrogenase family)